MPKRDPFPMHLERLVSGLCDLLPKALDDWDVDAIHDARVATRRLRAATDIFQSVLPANPRKRFARALRRLRRRLGPLRDIDVMLEHLGEFGRAAGHREASQWVEQRLIEHRDALRQDVQAKYPVDRALRELGEWWSVRSRTRTLKTDAAPLLAELIPVQFIDFASQADGLARPEAAEADSHAVHDPHALRIAGKAVRYALELAVAAGFALPKLVLKQFKRMQDALGLWHDYVVLSQRVLALAIEHDLAYHDQAMYGHVLELARHALRQANVRLRQFATLWNRGGTKLVVAVRARFPSPAWPVEACGAGVPAPRALASELGGKEDPHPNTVQLSKTTE